VAWAHLAERLARVVGVRGGGRWGSGALCDSWTWGRVRFRGYRNRRGETDHLLVGPRGGWAMEVKYRGAGNGAPVTAADPRA
jgi:hypothetical protein